jgi:hypothetical protein
MATTTPLNGWPVPTSTDYVKDGATAIEALGDAIDTSVGSGLLAWTSYTPTFNNFTLGNGTITYAKYAKLGKIVLLEVSVTLGSTSSVSGRIGVSLPVTASAGAAGNRVTGSVQLAAGAGTSSVGSTAIANSTQIDFYAVNTAGTYAVVANTSATVPGTWALNSFFSFKTFYEAA